MLLVLVLLEGRFLTVPLEYSAIVVPDV